MTPPVTRLPVKTPRQRPATAEAQAHPLKLVERLRQRIDQLFHELDLDLAHWPPARLAAQLPIAPARPLPAGTPAADLVEGEREYQMTVELPGIEASDVELSVANDILTIRAEKHPPRDARHDDRHVAERHYGLLRRSQPLPAGVDPDCISASFADGVLRIRLPKSAEALQPPRRIPVRPG